MVTGIDEKDNTCYNNQGQPKSLRLQQKVWYATSSLDTLSVTSVEHISNNEYIGPFLKEIQRKDRLFGLKKMLGLLA